MSDRKKFMFMFGAGCAFVAGVVTFFVVPWLTVPATVVAGVTGVLFTPRSSQAIAASKPRALTEAAKKVTEADWQYSNEL